MVDTIQGDFGFLEAQKTSKEKIFIWRKQARRKLSCDVVHLFFALVIIGIFFDLTPPPLVSESIEAHTMSNNGKIFNEWITRKQQNQ